MSAVVFTEHLCALLSFDDNSMEQGHCDSFHSKKLIRK